MSIPGIAKLIMEGLQKLPDFTMIKFFKSTES